MAPGQGLEPRLAGSEPARLPLTDPGTVPLYVSTREGVRLAVAVRTQESEILPSVVILDSVDVIEDERQRLSLPRRSHPALGALIFYLSF